MNEGAKATRSGRTAFGGLRSDNPALTSQVLIAINVVVWLLITVTGGTTSRWVDRLALLPKGLCRSVDGTGYYPGATEQLCATVPGTWSPGVDDGAVWQLLTSVFTHVDLMHIGFNMLALWFLGPQLEAAIGRVRFLALYLLSGLCGSALVFWLAGPHTPTLGASGAIFGLMGGLLLIAIKVRANPSQLLMWIGLNFVITVLGRGFISWQGHLGGFLGGALIGAVIAYAPRRNRALWQIGGLSLIGVAIAVACLARAAVLA